MCNLQKCQRARMKLFYSFLLFVCVLSISFSQNNFEIGREFGLFTSRNLSGYIKPLTTSISQSLNSGLYTTMNYSNGWSFGLNFTISNMFIPETQKTYDAELPDKFGDQSVVITAHTKNGKLIMNQSGNIKEPTIYGGISTPVFAAPQNPFPPDSFYKSVAYVEGNDISSIAGLPAIQLFLGFPTQTQIRGRFFTFNLNQSPLIYYSIILNQKLSEHLGLFESGSPYSLGIGLSYHSIKRITGIDISGYSAALNFSGNFENGFGFYTALQYEDFFGNIIAQRKTQATNEFVNNPFEEVRKGLPLEIDISTFTNFRALGGINYRYGIAELNVDFAFASQPIISGGLTLYFMDYKPVQFEFQNIEMPTLIDTIPLIARNFLIKETIFTSPLLTKQIIPIVAKIEITDKENKPVDKIVVEIYRSRQLRALLPYIFFDENSANIPQRYIQLNNIQAQKFTYKDLLGKNTVETYYHVLNIIGKRMQDFPYATITLVGCNSNQGKEKNNRKLSQMRADIVKKYLVDTWQIDPGRIKIIARNLPEKPSNPKDPEGIVENRRVEITSDYWEIIEPIMIEDVVKKIQPDNIVLKQEVSSPKPITNLNLNINTQNSKIRNIPQITPNTQSIEIDLLSQQLAAVDDTLRTYLEVSNEDETAFSEVQKTPIEVVNKEISLNYYNLILFDFDKSELGKANTKIADFIRKDIKPNSKIKISGFTDRIGDDKYNKKLSTDRARSTANKLNIPNSKYDGVGEDKLLYDNSLPEGRFYCRTVLVEVEEDNK